MEERAPLCAAPLLWRSLTSPRPRGQAHHEQGGRAHGRPQPPSSGQPWGTGPPGLTLRSFLCSGVFSHTRTHTHGLALSHLRAQASLSVKWAQLFALGRGLARASKTQLWNASGKGMGLHTGPASMAANASWEVAQDEALESGQGPPEFPGGRNELGRGLLTLARWLLSLGTSQYI